MATGFEWMVMFLKTKMFNNRGMLYYTVVRPQEAVVTIMFWRLFSDLRKYSWCKIKWTSQDKSKYGSDSYLSIYLLEKTTTDNDGYQFWIHLQTLLQW